MEVSVIGAGLAGSEAAWFLAEHGVSVKLYEAKPSWKSPAHKTDNIAELVCSNSLKSNDTARPSGLLKEELRKMGSLLMEAADKTKVPAGSALAVDRVLFSQYIEEKLKNHKNITIIREEVKEIPKSNAIIATGPLTSKDLFDSLSSLVGEELYFYDAIAPVVEAASIDYSKTFKSSRWEKGEEAYINCPLNKEQYETLVMEIIGAKKVVPREFEEPIWFESCLPVEVMSQRGLDVLRFGPLRPVGLKDPETGKTPWAVVQLRMENKFGSAYNLVGFQTRMKYKEQDRVLKLIPALEKAVILKHGEIHRNSYINAPAQLEDGMRIKNLHEVYVAGLLLGVEGYVESIAMGLFTALHLWSRSNGVDLPPPPPTTALGGLYHHISTSLGKYSPTNINFGLWPPLKEKQKKRVRHLKLIERAVSSFDDWLNTIGEF
jgi:methylenetetrahydrofolate--tRNA-(uracil-5-)-methyltransferase